MTGFREAFAAGVDALVPAESWAKAKAGKTSVPSTVRAKMQVVLEDFS
jgi:hypothetical protein